VKSSSGYNLTSLLVGSEGTLGVITELTLRLYGIPEYTIAVRAAFPDLDDACNAAAAIIGSGVLVTRCELLDALTLAAVNEYRGTDYAEEPSLFLEFGGTEAGVAGDLETTRELAEAEGCVAFQHETDAQAKARLWEARHNVLFALLHGTPGKLHKATDVCVPVSELPAAMAHARAAIDRHRMEASIVAHAGDGNYHVLFMLDPDDPRELERAEELNGEIVEWALEHGGTCTGEHGIGIGKIAYLEREHADLLPLMRAVKDAFDPNGILNPGKVLS
jgi:D-lactate dehydrogenase (cytochrome)